MEHAYLDYNDPQDMADEIAERSSNINEARDAAYEHGVEDFVMGEPKNPEIWGFFGQLAIDYRDGWDTAALEAREAA